jgi:type II secretory pathway pseudopilin PulG
MIGDDMRKKGVSLIALIITIAVMIIIATVTILKVSNSISKAKVSVFNSDFSTVEEAVHAYLNT